MAQRDLTAHRPRTSESISQSNTTLQSNSDTLQQIRPLMTTPCPGRETSSMIIARRVWDDPQTQCLPIWQCASVRSGPSLAEHLRASATPHTSRPETETVDDRDVEGDIDVDCDCGINVQRVALQALCPGNLRKPPSSLPMLAEART